MSLFSVLKNESLRKIIGSITRISGTEITIRDNYNRVYKANNYTNAVYIVGEQVVISNAVVLGRVKEASELVIFEV